ncbi:DUF4214 domain-containing protein [Novosphingobium sp. 9U]|uniref:DUF4214 domain-containing protein n=1 Tax=Novosphingobium sp. 9U TaxID=2653158 RepID=UPI0012F1E20F|nr:DUF4214 domain-containing protein [Novosphingobium sp. 9U]VWX48726.1 hypothetical protein NOVOSPHI9U_20069 [Novosphingobium sp. 9U]
MKIVANPDAPLDMYDTAIASGLLPSSYTMTNGSITINYQELDGTDSSYIDVLHGDTLNVSNDVDTASGIVTSLEEFDGSVRRFTISDFKIDLAGNDYLFSADRGLYFDKALAGNDHITGSNGDDHLFGGDGDDTIYGLGGADEVDGGEGNDTIYSVGNGSFIYGGEGLDNVVYVGLARSYGVMPYSDSTAVSSDIMSSVEDVHFRDATLTFDANSNAAFVMRLYDTTLHREPDAVGLDDWLDALAVGQTRGDVAHGFLNSPEYEAATGRLSNSDFVEFLYNSALGRPSDVGGKADWVRGLEEGLSRTDVLIGFSESEEHRAQTAGTLAKGLWDTDNDYQAVAALYDAFNNRLPDAAGLQDWVDKLKGGMSLNQVAEGFASSPEFAQATADLSKGQLVEFMYENALGRASDPNGQNYWLAQLDSDFSKGDLLLSFSESAEHYTQMQEQLFAGVEYII